MGYVNEERSRLRRVVIDITHWSFTLQAGRPTGRPATRRGRGLRGGAPCFTLKFAH